MMILVLWIENVFSHGSGVSHIVYGVWGGYRRALPFSPFIFSVVPFGMYLDYDENIGIFAELASCFCKSDFNGFIMNNIFEKLKNVVGKFSVLHKIGREDFFLLFYKVFIVDQIVIHVWMYLGM